MTTDSIISLKKIATAHLKYRQSIANVLGQQIANELTDGYKDLLKSLETEKIDVPTDPPIKK